MMRYSVLARLGLLRRTSRKRTWRTYVVSVCLLLVVMFVAFQIQHPMYFRKFRPRVKENRACTPPHVLRELVEFTNDVHLVLDRLNITNFLLYGSHWGAIRAGAPLPWDDDADIGIIADANYLALTPRQFVDAFVAPGVKIVDNIAQKTSLKLTRGAANVDVMVYYDYNGVMRRKGWEPFLIPIHYRLHHSFPTWVVQTPPRLPTMKFGKYDLPVPRAGIEIMKSLYRYNWWEDVKADNICAKVQW